MKQSTMIFVGIGVLVLGVIGYVVFSSMGNQPVTSSSTTNNSMTNESETGMVEEESGQNIVEVAQNAGTFKTLLAAAQAAGLVTTLTGAGPYTVFAPTDDAFAKLPAGTVESLLKDKEQLTAILTYHVVPGKVMASDVAKLTSATTVQGGDVTITSENGKVMINDATVTSADIEATNGVIHVIDTVLMPK